MAAKYPDDVELNEGPTECEYVYEGEEGVRERKFEKCEKNPKHLTFKKVTEWTIEDLPENIRSEENVELIKKKIDQTVRIRVLTKDKKIQFGTGIISRRLSEEPIINEKCPCNKCSEEGAEPRYEYTKVTVSTATHVVHNNDEARNSIFSCFYDEEGVENEKKAILYGLCIDGTNTTMDIMTESDVCEVICVTHDPAIMERVWNLAQPTLLNVTASTFPPEGVIISHPHGLSKRITFGQVLHVTVPLLSYKINTPTDLPRRTKCRHFLDPAIESEENVELGLSPEGYIEMLDMVCSLYSKDQSSHNESTAFEDLKHSPGKVSPLIQTNPRNSTDQVRNQQKHAEKSLSDAIGEYFDNAIRIAHVPDEFGYSNTDDNVNITRVTQNLLQQYSNSWSSSGTRQSNSLNVFGAMLPRLTATHHTSEPQNNNARKRTEEINSLELSKKFVTDLVVGLSSFSPSLETKLTNIFSSLKDIFPQLVNDASTIADSEQFSVASEVDKIISSKSPKPDSRDSINSNEYFDSSAVQGGDDKMYAKRDSNKKSNINDQKDRNVFPENPAPDVKQSFGSSNNNEHIGDLEDNITQAAVEMSLRQTIIRPPTTQENSDNGQGTNISLDMGSDDGHSTTIASMDRGNSNSNDDIDEVIMQAAIEMSLGEMAISSFATQANPDNGEAVCSQLAMQRDNSTCVPMRVRGNVKDGVNEENNTTQAVVEMPYAYTPTNSLSTPHENRHIAEPDNLRLRGAPDQSAVSNYDKKGICELDQNVNDEKKSLQDRYSDLQKLIINTESHFRDFQAKFIDHSDMNQFLQRKIEKLSEVDKDLEDHMISRAQEASMKSSIDESNMTNHDECDDNKCELVTNDDNDDSDIVFEEIRERCVHILIETHDTLEVFLCQLKSPKPDSRDSINSNEYFDSSAVQGGDDKMDAKRDSNKKSNNNDQKDRNIFPENPAPDVKQSFGSSNNNEHIGDLEDNITQAAVEMSLRQTIIRPPTTQENSDNGQGTNISLDMGSDDGHSTTIASMDRGNSNSNDDIDEVIMQAAIEMSLGEMAISSFATQANPDNGEAVCSQLAMQRDNSTCVPMRVRGNVKDGVNEENNITQAVVEMPYADTPTNSLSTPHENRHIAEPDNLRLRGAPDQSAVSNYDKKDICELDQNENDEKNSLQDRYSDLQKRIINTESHFRDLQAKFIDHNHSDMNQFLQRKIEKLSEVDKYLEDHMISRAQEASMKSSTDESNMTNHDECEDNKCELVTNDDNDDSDIVFEEISERFVQILIETHDTLEAFSYQLEFKQLNVNEAKHTTEFNEQKEEIKNKLFGRFDPSTRNLMSDFLRADDLIDSMIGNPTSGLEFEIPDGVKFILPLGASYAMRFEDHPGWFSFPAGTKLVNPVGNEVLIPHGVKFNNKLFHPKYSYITYKIDTCPGSSGAAVYCGLLDNKSLTHFPHFKNPNTEIKKINMSGRRATSFPQIHAVIDIVNKLDQEFSSPPPSAPLRTPHPRKELAELELD